jgi:putative FmdB family regulatory protein
MTVFVSRAESGRFHAFETLKSDSMRRIYRIFACTVNQVHFDGLGFNRYRGGMPIYEFHCGKCGADSEILVRSSRWKGTSCPKCGSKRLAKKLSVFASGGGQDSSEPAGCTGVPGSCGLCGAGRPHSH